MSMLRAWRTAGVGARYVAAAAASVAAVALAATLAFAPPAPRVAAAAPAVEVLPAATPTVLVCPGDLLIGGRTAGDAGALAAAAPARVESAGTPEPDESPIEPATDASGPGTLALRAVGGDRPAEVAAASSSRAAADDIAGLAAASCAPPRFESWLAGGTTVPGATTLVTLANPGEVAASVELTVYGAAGAVQAPGGTDLVVGPGERLVVPVAGIAPDEAAPVVQVRATRAPVTAFLQYSEVQTLQPVGADVIAPSAASAPRQSIAGVRVPASEGIEPLTVRLLSADDDATAVVSVTAEGEAAPSETVEVDLAAGVPVDVAVPGLDEGAYGVRVEASAPVVAAARTTTTADAAWSPAAEALEAPALFAVPDGGDAELGIAAGDEAATVTVTDASGDEPQSIELAAGSYAALALEPGTWRLSSTTAVTAAVAIAEGNGAAVVAVLPAAADTAPVRVYP